MTTANANDYDWWYRALAGEQIGGVTLPVHDSDPHCGFYRKRVTRAGAFVPVAIWRESEDRLIALVDGKVSNAYELWTWVCRYPITQEQYEQRVNTGKWWDEADTIADAVEDDPARHGMGGNNPPEETLTEFERLERQIKAAIKGADVFNTINSDEECAKAQSLRALLNELGGKADKGRKSEKDPHWAMCQAVDAKWQPIIKMADATAKAIAKAMSAFMTAKARREAEEAAAAEVARRKADEEAQKAAASSENVTPMPPRPAPTPEPEAPKASSVRGGYGRAASVRTVKTALVTDYDKAYAYMKDHPELKALIDVLAQRAVEKGFDVPGVVVHEERKVV